MGDSYKKIINPGPFGATDKQRLFDFLEVHFAHPKEDILTDVRKHIGDLDKVPPIELGRGRRIPEGLRGWMLGKNDVLRDDGQGLTDSELAKAFRASNVANAYHLNMKLLD